jgi:DNA-binding NarL/FixJ family response regulator
MKRITVLLAEDHMVVREGLQSGGGKRSQVVGEAQTGRQAVALAKKLRPAVVVMDIAMPLLNGLEATRQIRKAIPGARVLMLSAHGEDAYVEQAIAFGAVGFLLKQTSSHDLSRAIREVQKGKTFFSPSIAKRLRDQKSPAKGRLLRKRAVRLSSREMEILQLIAEGDPANRRPMNWASAQNGREAPAESCRS